LSNDCTSKAAIGDNSIKRQTPALARCLELFCLKHRANAGISLSADVGVSPSFTAIRYNGCMQKRFLPMRVARAKAGSANARGRTTIVTDRY